MEEKNRKIILGALIAVLVVLAVIFVIMLTTNKKSPVAPTPEISQKIAE